MIISPSAFTHSPASAPHVATPLSVAVLALTCTSPALVVTVSKQPPLALTAVTCPFTSISTTLGSSSRCTFLILVVWSADLTGVGVKGERKNEG